MKAKPLFTVGLFADAQYADRDDYIRPGEGPGRVKYFRGSKDRLNDALTHFMQKETLETMSCIINLGDLVDGVNDDDVSVDVPTRRTEVPKHLTEKNMTDLKTMVDVINRTVKGAVPVFHCLGNHDLNVSRETALEVLYSGSNKGGLNKQPAAAYFSKKLPREWRLLVLDTTELNPRFSAVGSATQLACETYVKELKGSNEDLPIKPWGGGIGATQLEWLREQLLDAETKNQKVIIASHVPLSRTAARPGMALWNCDEVSELLESSTAVKLCIAGHDHVGCYGRTLVKHPVDGNFVFGRVHFVTVEAMLEAPPNANAFAVLEVYDHEVVVNAGGTARGFFGNPVVRGDINDDRTSPNEDTSGDAESGDGGTTSGDTTNCPATETGFECLVERWDEMSGSGTKTQKHNTAQSVKNMVTDRRLRVSPRGRFTGVASFGDRTVDGGKDATKNSETRKSNNPFEETNLLDWINAHVDDDDVDLR
tara:strand:+ start:3406 stop:4845 length:1440 start_codon:yes stop_codon:yes gene_type:complete